MPPFMIFVLTISRSFINLLLYFLLHNLGSVTVSMLNYLTEGTYKKTFPSPFFKCKF